MHPLSELAPSRAGAMLANESVVDFVPTTRPSTTLHAMDTLNTTTDLASMAPSETLNASTSNASASNATTVSPSWRPTATPSESCVLDHWATWSACSASCGKTKSAFNCRSSAWVRRGGVLLQMAAIESQAAGSCKYLPTLHVTRLLNAWRRATRTSVRSTAASRIGQHGANAQLRAVVARGHAHAWCILRRRVLVRSAPNCRYALLVRTKRQSAHGSSVLCCSQDKVDCSADCRVDCTFTSWAAWGACSGSCATAAALQARVRLNSAASFTPRMVRHSITACLSPMPSNLSVHPR
jgi:hypothetical protein